MDKTYQSYFFNLMDVLIDWKNNYKGLEQSYISVSFTPQEQIKSILVIGYIRDSEREIKETIVLAKQFPDSTDGKYINNLLDWFDLGDPYRPYDNSANAFYQKCGAFASDNDLLSALTELEMRCKEKYPNVNIDFHMPQKTSKGCYIATAVYGSYNCPQLWILRRFRDEKLSKNYLGNLFIKFYYKTSPYLVKRFGNCKIFNTIFKTILDKYVVFLKKNGINDSYYTD